ncbi:hypothetical protein [Tissierella sp.]|uniref:hypothetical protein n=1 Tax=Tissierella sp. TaxID=41274 RepID=UPI003075878F
MNKLRTQLNKILKSIHPNAIVQGKSKSRVHFQFPTDETPFPYIVYDLPQSYFEDDLEVFNLDVDIWDNKTDTTEIETLSQAIWNELNRYHFINNDMQFTIYRQSRLTIEDDDPRIRRRTLIFQLRYYDRSVN